MADDRDAVPEGEPGGHLPAGSGMTGPFGQQSDKWRRSPTPAGIAALVILVVAVVVVILILVAH